MCGIAGFFLSGQIDADVLGENMRRAIRYRGRDTEGTFEQPGVIKLIHARLAIVDLATGAQPIKDYSGRYVIIHNGEIYNYLELRQQYEQAGAHFRTQSDTEVILEGFKLKGPKVCSDLNGMFAFAIWDIHERRLFMARDRLGKKPLYWTVLRGSLYFASTLDAFANIPGWTGELLPDVLTMQGRHCILPLRHTVYSKAFALPPASWAYATTERQVPVVTRYWCPQFLPKKNLSEEDALDEYEDLLADAIRVRLRADVPLALTFSGGVDSGTIAVLAAQRLNRSLTCYCIDNHTPENPSEETIIALRTAAILGLPVEHIPFDQERDILDCLAEAIRYFDQPTTQFAITYSMKLYKTIKHYATVVLSGAGGDELFAGYNGDEAFLRQDRGQPIRFTRPPWLRHLVTPRVANILKIGMDFPYNHTRIYAHYGGPTTMAFAEDLRKLMMDSGVDSNMDLLMFAGLYMGSAQANYMLPDINGLQAQVEVRSPFLDYRLVEFAASLPHTLKVHNPDHPSGNKWLPKRLYERYVPQNIAWASKKGMGYNIRFDHSLAMDPNYAVAFETAMRNLEQHGMATQEYRDAFALYQVEKRRDIMGAPQCGNTLCIGFLLGTWLARDLSMLS